MSISGSSADACCKPFIKRNFDEMTSKHLVLTNFTSRLGIFLLNHNVTLPPKKASLSPPSDESILCSNFSISETQATDINNVREEAALLLSFMLSVPSTNESLKNICGPNIGVSSVLGLSPSFSFEAKIHNTILAKQSSTSPSFQQLSGNLINDNEIKETPLSLTCPSLSINHKSVLSPCATKNLIGPNPAQLFSRHLSTAKYDHTNSHAVAETLATNIMDSFITALDWRAKSWIISLTKVLQLRMKNHKFANASDCSENDSKTVSTKINESAELNLNFEQMVVNSAEAKVITSLAHASSSVMVRDIRTSFQVLEQLTFNEARENLLSEYCSSKKRKIDENQQSYTSNPDISNLSNACKLSNAILLSSSLTISLNGCDPSLDAGSCIVVNLETPGTISGTFKRSKNNELSLSDVDLRLDTEALARSMEDNSRLVIRKVAEKNMLLEGTLLSKPISLSSTSQEISCKHSMNTDDVSELEDSLLSSEDSLDKDLNQYSFVGNVMNENDPTQEYSVTPEASSNYCLLQSCPHIAVVTPHQSLSSSNSSRSLKRRPINIQPPRLRLDEGYENHELGFKINPRIKNSASELLNPNNNVPIDDIHDEKTENELMKDLKSKLVTLPALVSPIPSINERNILKDYNYHSEVDLFLPALVKVACAAIRTS